MTQDDSSTEQSLLLLPIPAPSMNNSQSSFIVTTDNEWRSLPPEVASADISIARTFFLSHLKDSSFLHPQLMAVSSRPHPVLLLENSRDATTSTLASEKTSAHHTPSQPSSISTESKCIASGEPYLSNQSYIIIHIIQSRRDAVAPAAAAEEAEHKASISNDASRSRASKSRSRLSVHNFLTQNKLKPQDTHPTQPRRLLRRTRSIPDMFGIAASASAAGPSTQSTPTGRIHSHSVTGADMPRPLPTPLLSDLPKSPTSDEFADVMHWPHNTSVSSTPESETKPLPGFIPYPFGLGATFDSPTRPSSNGFLPMPHALREMQSFESGRTARAGDTIRRSDTPDTILSLSISPDLHPSSPTIVPPDPELTPLPETSMHSRYSTEVFDVLQTYRGLPQLDRLFSDSAGETTIKMSLRAEDSAAPRNDPRFVLWGEMQVPPDIDGDDLSSRGGMSSPSTHSRRGREVPAVRVDGDGTKAKVLIAATIERWIAQLTSELDYDELLNFFLTYRTYISAVDLCHLLICRFHWALSGRDDMVRKIVRVRTFVAIRYWLLTFFVMDFLPNRELRLLLASWLNTLVKDPILKKHEDGLVSSILL